MGKRGMGWLILAVIAMVVFVGCQEEEVIAIQDGTACGVRPDGTAVCWGTGHSYDLTPPAGVTFSSVVAAQEFAAGLTTGGTLRSWGMWTSAPTGAFQAVAAGRLTACGLRTGSGGIQCWGGSSFSTGTTSPNYFSIAMSDQSTLCAIDTGYHVDCWNVAGGATPLEPSSTEQFGMISLGGGGCGIHTDRTLACWGNSLTPPTGNDWNEIATGNGFACAARQNGNVTCWGSNTYGQTSAPSGAFRELSAFGQSICGQRTDGTVSCWGREWFGVTTPPTGLVLQVPEE